MKTQKIIVCVIACCCLCINTNAEAQRIINSMKALKEAIAPLLLTEEQAAFFRPFFINYQHEQMANDRKQQSFDSTIIKRRKIEDTLYRTIKERLTEEQYKNYVAFLKKVDQEEREYTRNSQLKALKEQIVPEELSEVQICQIRALYQERDQKSDSIAKLYRYQFRTQLYHDHLVLLFYWQNLQKLLTEKQLEKWKESMQSYYERQKAALEKLKKDMEAEQEALKK